MSAVVVLNGAPRSGKTSIARAIQSSFDGVWVNLGVDLHMQAAPEHVQPAIGLRPGGERPDLEPVVATLYSALYDSVAAHQRLGLGVVVDVGHHEGHSRPLGTWEDAHRRLEGLPVLWVGVRCPLDVVMARRGGGEAPAPVVRWQEAVHAGHAYDVEVDTSVLSPAEAAEVIRSHLPT